MSHQQIFSTDNPGLMVIMLFSPESLIQISTNPLSLVEVFHIFYFSMMDLRGLLSSCQSFILHWYWLSTTVAKLPSILVVCLCGGMLWQCSTCLLKYFDRPTQASIFYDSAMAPISITVCYKGIELNYTFPELDAVDIREGTGEDWITAWAAQYNEFATDTPSNNFIFNNIANRLQQCKSIQVKRISLSDLRIRHHSSTLNKCQLNKINVYLHNHGLFNARDFYQGLDKNLLISEKNYTLSLALETIQSLNTPDFNCNEYTNGQSLDSCLVAEAMQAANNTAGCIFKYNG
jgi:hypothetical protein